MTFGRKEADEAEYRRLRYADSDILRNKLDIREPARLEEAENALVENRLREGLPPAALELTYAGLKAIHHHLLQDVYDWAGQERAYSTGRGLAPFAPPDQIAPWLQKQFSSLSSESNLVGLKPEAFARRAAHYLNEINAVHPFVEGNGRTQRVWLRLLASNAGFILTLASHHRERWYEVSKIGFHHSDEPMSALILENLAHDTVRTRLGHTMERSESPTDKSGVLAREIDQRPSSGPERKWHRGRKQPDRER